MNNEIMPMYFAECLRISFEAFALRKFARCFKPQTEPIVPRIRVIGYFMDSLNTSISLEYFWEFLSTL